MPGLNLQAARTTLEQAAYRARGFTLIELLGTLAILALAGTLALPAYRDWQSRIELEEASASFIAAAHAARSHALASGHNAMVQAHAGNWNRGWRVFGDVDGDGQWNADSDTLLHERGGLRQGVLLSVPEGATGSANTLRQGYLMFNAQGFARTREGSLANGRLEFRLQHRVRAVLFHRTGRIRSCDDSACA